jgi:hypothetical protein
MKRFLIIVVDDYSGDISISGIYETKEQATAQMQKIFNFIVEDTGHGETEKITETGFVFCAEGADFLCSIKSVEAEKGENFFAIDVERENSKIKISKAFSNFDDASECLETWFEQKKDEYGDGDEELTVLEDDYYSFMSEDDDFFYGAIKSVNI